MTDMAPPNRPQSHDAARGSQRAARAWTAWLNAMCVLLLWRYVDPWAAWGYLMFLLVLAVALDFWPVRDAAS